MTIEYNNLQRNYFTKINITLLHKICELDTKEQVVIDRNKQNNVKKIIPMDTSIYF